MQYNPFLGSPKATLFQLIMETEDAQQRAAYLQRVLQVLPEKEAQAAMTDIGIGGLAAAFGGFLAEIFSSRTKK